MTRLINKKTRAAAIAGATIVAATVVLGWFTVGSIELPQSVLLGQQTTSEHEYTIAWPYGHHYVLELRSPTGGWDIGLTGTVAIARNGKTLLEKPVTASDNMVRVTCPQTSGQVKLDAGTIYSIKVHLNYPREIDRVELRLTGLKDYRDVWMGR